MPARGSPGGSSSLPGTARPAWPHRWAGARGLGWSFRILLPVKVSSRPARRPRPSERRFGFRLGDIIDRWEAQGTAHGLDTGPGLEAADCDPPTADLDREALTLPIEGR